MKELTQQEIAMVSGAGIIQDALSNAGSWVGSGLYGLVSNIAFDVRLLGYISIGSLFPDLGKNIGSSAGSKVGWAIESVIAHIPLVGSWLNGLLGNSTTSA